ncbi:MAG: hypothetical protein ABFC57_08410 [Veillonellales bacterium]
MTTTEYTKRCGIFCPEELEERARKLAAFSVSAATNGNTIALFTMLVLQEILEQLAADPATNLTGIVAVSASIASLNNSIQLIDP